MKPELANDPTIEADVKPHLRLVDDEQNADSTGEYTPNDVDEIADKIISDSHNSDLDKMATEPKLSPFYHESTHVQLPFQTIRDTLVWNLPKLRANLLDRKGLLEDLDQTTSQGDIDKTKNILVGFHQAEEKIAETNRSIASLINPEAIDRTIEQLQIYKDAFLKHLEKIQNLAKDPSLDTQDRIQLTRFVGNNVEELDTVNELIDFCLQEKARIQVEQTVIEEKPEDDNEKNIVVDKPKSGRFGKIISGIFTRNRNKAA